MIEFRPAQPFEAATLFDLHSRSVEGLCREAYAPETLNEWFLDRDANFYIVPIGEGRVHVADNQGNVVGFVELNTNEITNIFVDPNLAGQGIGSFLLERGLGLLEAQGSILVHIEATLNSVPFYLKHGFVETGRDVWTSPTGKVKIPVVLMERPFKR